MRPFTSCSWALLSLWLQSEEVCCYEGREERRTLHRDSGGWDQTPEICKFLGFCLVELFIYINIFLLGIHTHSSIYLYLYRYIYLKLYPYIYPKLWMIYAVDANSVHPGFILFAFIWNAEVHISHVSVYLLTLIPGWNLWLTVKNQPNCLFSKSRIWTLYLLINITRNRWSSPPGSPARTCKYCRLYSGVDQWKNLYFVLNFSINLLLENALSFWHVCIITLPNIIALTYAFNSPQQYASY